MEELHVHDLYINDLEIDKFAGMIKDNTQCYKFYWLESLLNLLDEGKKEITYFEAITEMIILAWYTVTYYHLSTGSDLKALHQVNALESAIKALQSVAELDENADIEVIREAILEHRDDKNFKGTLNNLTRYVPYAALKSFGVSLRVENKKSNSKERIITYYNEINKTNPLPYYFGGGNGLDTCVIWNDCWANMVLENLCIIKDWINYNKILYLQKRNPGVPGIAFKLDRAKVRKLNDVRNLWKIIMDSYLVIDIYDPEIVLNGTAYDVDHYIPWSFVAADELWNLCPVDSSLNRKKSNSLPIWERYFTAFANNQLLIRNGIHENEKIQKAFEKCRKDNLNAIWCQSLYNMQSDQEFVNALEENLYPIYKSAKIQGFSIWNGPAI